MSTDAAISDPAIRPPPEPFLILPGFDPDAVGFAIRATFALLLAYAAAFWCQLSSASSAGLCVAIVAQSSPGMAMSKAIYRVVGTLLGGVAAVALVSVFGQDRTMLLAAFTVWLGACTFVAAFLRDFRSYGAVLCGYTVGIIAISAIDTPQNVLLTTLDRVAAILLGVVCVAFANTLLTRNVSFEALVSGLRQALAEIALVGRRAMAGEPRPDAMACANYATTILALSTQASYAATELPDGPARIAGARAAIAALLNMLSAARAVALGRAAAAKYATAAPPPDGQAQTPREAFMLERVAALAQQERRVEEGLQTLEWGKPPAARVRLQIHYDPVGAGISALRTMIAVGLGSCFCIVSGWPGSTGLLVQQAAITALLAMQPNPTSNGVAFGLALPLPALLAGLVNFMLLPNVSGFVPFALAVGPCVFLLALIGHHPRTAQYGPALMLYFALLLAPSNVQSFDLASYLNTVLIQGVSVVFTLMAFRLILPVSRKRRFFRVADAILADLRRTMRHGRALDPAASQSLKYDRLAQAKLWLGGPTPARMAVFERLHAFDELDSALRRAWSGLQAAQPAAPGLAPLLDAACAALLQPDPAPLQSAAQALLDHPDASLPEVLRAISGLYGAQALLAREARSLRHYGVVRGLIMLRETNVFGIFISPLVAYMLAALLAYLCLRPLLVRLGLQRWAWNVPLAEVALYTCILGMLVAFL